MNQEKMVDFIKEGKDTLRWIAQWARARLWHAVTLAFVLGLGLGAML